MATKDAKRVKTGLQPIQPYLMDDGTYLGEVVVTAKKRTPAQKRRYKKKQVRKKKRLDIRQINIEANIEALNKKLETVEQKRDPYSRGGVAKAN